MKDPMDDFKDPDSPQPVMQPGAIDDATVPDRKFEEGAEVPIFDRVTGELRYERRP